MSQTQIALEKDADSNIAGDLLAPLKACLDAIVVTGVQACLLQCKLPQQEEPIWLSQGPSVFALCALEEFARAPTASTQYSVETEQDGDPTIWLGRKQSVNSDYLMVALDLIGNDGLEIGHLGFAFECASWDSESVLHYCKSQARLIVAMLATWQAHQETQQDLQAENHRAKMFRRRAEIDPLTRLENAAAFKLKAQDRLQTEEDRLALILIDIDKFKEINDIYGHRFGDRYLQLVADAIRNCFSAATLIGRIGGDEFAALLPYKKFGQSHIEQMMSICSAAILRATAKLGKPELGKVSMGAGLFPEQADSYERLFDLADAALYASKSAGRGTSTIFHTDQHERFNGRLLQTRFDTAVSRGEVVPFLQPIVCLRTGQWRGFEVLARWQDPMRGLLAPGAFSPVFKDPAMSSRLTHEMVQRAVHALVQSGNTRPYLSINLTIFDLMSQEFVFDLQSLLKTSGLDWSSVVLEVTETSILGKIGGPAHRGLTEMRMRGARVALDDFGTGFGGLMHLKDWPIDIIKIDQQFIRKLAQDKRDQSIVRAIIKIGQDLGLDIVAEGIETEETRQMLADLGCPHGQGYLFARPFPSSELPSDPTPRLSLISAS